MQLRNIIPFFDANTQTWAIEARMIRWLTFVWLLLGLLVMFSASYPAGQVEQANGWFYLQRQGIFILVGMLGFNLIVHAPLRYILSLAHWGLLGCLGLIFVTILPGVGQSVGGAARWIPIGPFLLQPSEFIKPFLVLQSARIFGQWDRLTWRTRLTWVGIFGVVLLAILAQPNLSTTALCGMTIWLIAVAAGLPSVYLLSTAGGGVLLATLSVSLREYQRKRILSFLNPWEDATGDGYQLTQSLMAIGSGGWFGTGYGQSQQKMGFLPIQYTDFIFAVYSEEFGLLGGLLLLVLLVGYATLGFYIAQKSQSPVHRLVAIGVTVLMVGQACLNIAVASGAIPTTGLPFPLWSYGGSSMLASLLAAALLIRVARENSEAAVVTLPVEPPPPTQPTVVPFPGRKRSRGSGLGMALKNRWRSIFRARGNAGRRSASIDRRSSHSQRRNFRRPK
jgi:cell division protein FtsW